MIKFCFQFVNWGLWYRTASVYLFKTSHCIFWGSDFTCREGFYHQNAILRFFLDHPPLNFFNGSGAQVPILQVQEQNIFIQKIEKVKLLSQLLENTPATVNVKQNISNSTLDTNLNKIQHQQWVVTYFLQHYWFCSELYVNLQAMTLPFFYWQSGLM